MRLWPGAVEHVARRGAGIDDGAPAAQLGEMQRHGGEQLLRIDGGGERPAERRVELFGMPGADRVGDFVEHQRGVVGAQRQHVVARQKLALGGKEHKLFELAAGDLAVIAELVAQRRGDVGLGRGCRPSRRSR